MSSISKLQSHNPRGYARSKALGEMDGLPREVKIEYIVMNICEWEWRLEKDQIGGGGKRLVRDRI